MTSSRPLLFATVYICLAVNLIVKSAAVTVDGHVTAVDAEGKLSPARQLRSEKEDFAARSFLTEGAKAICTQSTGLCIENKCDEAYFRDPGACDYYCASNREKVCLRKVDQTDANGVTTNKWKCCCPNACDDSGAKGTT
mmetsp:Transcript_59173/g.105168  ORF Transcript_59173/g.105168 Transcript_59173/m.105168 type:complete len:139 (-) Transcript_59173:56-472(-)|eukprot:CAMPEP_0197653492 /NCGR_PEP_ID=MMETSP1338-20131121/35777_1 /TAXON_ID=43686 ORGANISM="Pelagodinium beii, Strain RCC1491" /NCGR_SAMPLE_ID=MMETSP1338 /ASSEMBLY_ACC=CAM_ASM_000754 /LENGTH=138 /DNA_ID=CAMNT_0043228623 /DNA_START=44 /DNA_END=460 /DNA_ORIENTATION=-